MSDTSNTYSTIDYSKNLMDRIYNLEANIINLQKAIDNLQYNQSVQSSQTHLIKVRNNIITRTPSRITDERRLGLGYAANSADAVRAMSGVPSD
jgi:hypothetical protein